MKGELFSLAARVACVSGASSGIGRSIADAMARAGAAVVGVARREALLDEWVRDVEQAGGRAACRSSSWGMRLAAPSSRDPKAVAG